MSIAAREERLRPGNCTGEMALFDSVATRCCTLVLALQCLTQVALRQTRLRGGKFLSRAPLITAAALKEASSRHLVKKDGDGDCAVLLSPVTTTSTMTRSARLSGGGGQDHTHRITTTFEAQESAVHDAATSMAALVRHSKVGTWCDLVTATPIANRCGLRAGGAKG
jgi:hypothetical protein